MVTVQSFATLADAARSVGPETRYLAGGTLVMRAIAYGDQSFNSVLRVHDASLSNIRNESGRVRIGAGVTMSGILQAQELAFLHPVARVVGGPAVRNMATVGGNLFAPHPYGDFATALLALDGTVQFSDGSDLPLEQLLSNRERENRLVASISIARPAGDEFRFRKVSRVKPKGISVMCMAAWLPRSAGGISNARVAYGAMAPTPVRMPAVEAALQGASLDETGIERALGAAAQGLSPPDDALASAWYRTEVAPVHLKRMLLGEGRR